jgi:hypothetical protein
MKCLPACITAFLFALGTQITPCAGQSMPPGSYRETCRNIEVRGGVLHAQCRGIGGNWNTTSIRIAQCIGSEIVNGNGGLRCGGVIRPDGPYLQTCKNIHVLKTSEHRGFLMASCQDSSGRWRGNNLDIPCRGQVHNENGRLVCRA